MPNLREGEQRTIRAKAVRGSIFHGTVRAEESGVPLFHAEARFQSPAYPRTASTDQAAYTDAEGRFEFRYPIAPGPLDVKVSLFTEGSRSSQQYRVIVQDQPRTEANFRVSHGG